MNRNALILGLLFSLGACGGYHARLVKPFKGPIAPVEITVAPVHHPREIRPYNDLCRSPGLNICQSTA